ncbi:MAG: hypothetical protein IT428_20035 [Planctomycetaceae bacterium]|nr:hypothetical protein [Planctomycetaceae bacterium]
MPFSFPAVQGLLRCPKSRSELVQDGDGLVCVDPNCRLKFAVRDNIPIMLIDEATELSVDEWKAVMQRDGRTT